MIKAFTLQKLDTAKLFSSFLAPIRDEIDIEMNEQSFAVDELDNQIFLAEESLTEISLNHNSKGIVSKNLPETRALELLTKSPKHQYLLKHPVFMSFMWLKWERIHHTYSGNLRFYTLFTYILTWFIFDKFGYDRTDKGENSLIFVVTGFIFIFLMISIIKAFCTVEKELSNLTWTSLFFFHAKSADFLSNRGHWQGRLLLLPGNRYIKF